MSLELLGTARLDADELSGLAYHPERGTLLAVSDDAGRLWEISVDGEPEIVHEIKLKKGKKHDLEGVAVGPAGEIWIAAEQRRAILRYDLDGKLIERHRLDVDGEKDNDGLEGLTRDPDDGRIYALHERRPRELIELDASCAVIRRWPLEDFDDLSGVCADRGGLWIVSDLSNALGRFEPRGDGWRCVARFDLGDDSAEGVAVVGDRIYVAFDAGKENLRWYRRPT